MRFPRELERDALLSVQRDPDAHLIFGRGDPTPGIDPYRRADGALPVTRDGLQEFLHRRLYRLLMQPALGRRRLLRDCDVWGCANPYHFHVVEGLEPRSRTRCVHGHEYAGNTTPDGHCATCVAERRARRASHLGPDGAAINAAKTSCPHGHPYDEANTYWYETPAGAHRKCRACSRERSAARRRRTALAA